MGSAVNTGLSTEKTLSVVDSICQQPLCSNIVELPIADLLPSDSSPRTAGENASHTRMLAESATTLPPIVVHRATMQVVDGLHRVRAAQLRGDATIAGIFFDGSRSEAFVLSVKLNAAHGLPLSLAERKAAAHRILSLYPDWSDRSIAAIAGISRGTVAAIRSRSTGKFGQSTGRIARNGVLHRPNGPQGRQRAAELFTADPNASARKVALASGISLTTAKDVRKRLRLGEKPVLSDASTADASCAFGRVREPAQNDRVLPPRRTDTAELVCRLRRDPALRFSETGRRVLRWLETPLGDDADWNSIIDNIPSHCIPGIIEIARERSNDWLRLVHLLNQR
ncbi:ParB/RepB/Spo0J family partition protein [Nocardia sp. NPDC051570]|uniref:ParB/RepB/Spo0J family partition protein n=1 Tax=Nocardia sp. NPDC051570 TaxID=3364324 RepID=UPI0037A32C28